MSNSMPTPIAQIFKDKKYPKWFQNHSIFKEVKTIKKVFPSIGLPNCEEEAGVDNTEQATDAAISLINTIVILLNDRAHTLTAYMKNVRNKNRQAHGLKCLAILKSVNNLLKTKNIKDCIQINNGRISLKLSDNITIESDNRPIFRKNESLFRVYNKINELLNEKNFTPLTRLEDQYSFKTFSSENIPNNNKFKIIFSSDGKEGAWDIGTMSMRGISSCQSWDRGEYKYCTIGSVIDPFVGIIYMTSGGKFNEYGSKMMRRCIVRFVIDGKNNKPYILMDRMYPSSDNKTITQFKKFLEKKTSGKFDVEYSDKISHDLLKSSYLPLNPIRKKLKETSINGKGTVYDEYDTIQSYQDMRIANKTSSKKDKQAGLFEKNSKKKEGKFIVSFTKAFSNAVKSVDAASVPNTIKPVIKSFATKKNNYYAYDHVLNMVGTALAKYIVQNIDKTQFTNSDTYIRRVYYSFFNNRSKVIDLSKSELIKKLNGQLHLKVGKRFGVRNFVPLMNKVLPLMDKTMKEELKKVVDKRNQMKIEPLPLP